MPTPIELKVHVARDEETGRWFVAASDIPGMRVEADTADELIRAVNDVAEALIELNIEEILRNVQARSRAAAPPQEAKRPLRVYPVFDSPMAVACG